jgi:hypothetical protein
MPAAPARRRSWPWHPSRVGGSGAAVVVFAWWATGLRPFTGLAYAVVVGSGAAAMAWGARRPRPPARRWPVGSLLVWAALALGVAAWQLAAFVQHPRSLHPTLSSLANTALDPRPVRAGALALWLVLAARLARPRSGVTHQGPGPRLFPGRR